MGGLPDELWRRILEFGIRNCKLGFRDISCVSISCRQLYKLSGENSLWSLLLSSDFPQIDPSSSSAKSIYKTRFVRDRTCKLAAHRRAVLRAECRIAQCSRRLRELDAEIAQEYQKLRSTVGELSNLRNVRQASVALNVWQPQVVRSRHEELVEQCLVPVESRIHALEMELGLCKQQIACLKKAHKDEEQRLDAARGQLATIKYHPLRDYGTARSGHVEWNGKKRKLKRSIDCK